MFKKMFRKIFRKRFRVGDTVRLIRTGQKAEIIDKGTLALARKDVTTFVLQFEDGKTFLTVLPEEIETWRSK